MKNLIYTILAFTVICSSCVQDVDDVYDKPVAQRVEEAVQEYHDLLLSSEYGWLMEYYPHTKQLYGGLYFVMKFDKNDKVTISTDAFETPDKTAESLFSIKKDIGPTLNFDSYNEIFHYFSDPDIGSGTSLEGDYEFLLRSHTENEIILRGKKTKNFIRMTRLTKPGAEVLKASVKVMHEFEDRPGVLIMDGTINNGPLQMTFIDDRHLEFTHGQESVQTTFMFTETGIRFYQPITLAGVSFSGLTWVKETKSLTTNDGANVTLTFVQDPMYPEFVKYLGNWSFKYTSNSVAKEVSVTLKESTYAKTQKKYLMEGLPFNLYVDFLPAEKCMAIYTQVVGSGYVAFWEVQGKGSLTNAAGVGLKGVKKTGTENEYEFVDNGVWGDYVARAIILWSKSGEYKAYGDSRFTSISMVKKEN